MVERLGIEAGNRDNSRKTCQVAEHSLLVFKQLRLEHTKHDSATFQEIFADFLMIEVAFVCSAQLSLQLCLKLLRKLNVGHNTGIVVDLDKKKTVNRIEAYRVSNFKASHETFFFLYLQISVPQFFTGKTIPTGGN